MATFEHVNGRRSTMRSASFIQAYDYVHRHSLQSFHEHAVPVINNLKALSFLLIRTRSTLL